MSAAPARKQLVEVRVVLAGFGAVNKALARMLLEWEGRLRDEHRLVVRVVAITTQRHGSVLARGAGAYVDLEKALAMAEESGSHGLLDGRIVTRGGAASALSCPHGLSIEETHDFLRAAAAEIYGRGNGAGDGSNSIVVGTGALIEAIPVSYADGEPAAGMLRCALASGLHAVSANKGPVVHHRAALKALAAQGRRMAPASPGGGGPGPGGGGSGGCHAAAVSTAAAVAPLSYLHESAVMDGVPVFSLIERCLPLARLGSLRGCLNSTTTIVLSAMEVEGCTFAEALAKAQADGIAEADPSGDLEGMDAAVKLTALVRARCLSSKSNY